MLSGTARPDNDQVHGMRRGDHSKEGGARIAVDGNPLDPRGIHSRPDSNLERGVLMRGRMVPEGYSSVLQQADGVHHLEPSLSGRGNLRRPQQSGSSVP